MKSSDQSPQDKAKPTKTVDKKEVEKKDDNQSSKTASNLLSN